MRVTKSGLKCFKAADGLSIKSPSLCKLAAKQRTAQAKCSPAINEPVPNKRGLQGTVPWSPGHYKQCKDTQFPLQMWHCLPRPRQTAEQRTPRSRSPHYWHFVYLAAALHHITDLCLSLTQQSMTLGARNPELYKRTNLGLALLHEWAVTRCTVLFNPHHQGGQSAAHP